MPTLTVFGGASGKRYGPWKTPPQPILLLEFLRAQGIPVASSCAGEGVCRQCVVNENVLSCQLTVQRFLVDYPDGVVVIGYL